MSQRSQGESHRPGYWQEMPLRNPKGSRSSSMMFVPVQLGMFVEDEHVFVYMPVTAYKLAMP